MSQRRGDKRKKIGTHHHSDTFRPVLRQLVEKIYDQPFFAALKFDELRDDEVDWSKALKHALDIHYPGDYFPEGILTGKSDMVEEVSEFMRIHDALEPAMQDMTDEELDELDEARRRIAQEIAAEPEYTGPDAGFMMPDSERIESRLSEWVAHYTRPSPQWLLIKEQADLWYQASCSLHAALNTVQHDPSQSNKEAAHRAQFRVENECVTLRNLMRQLDDLEVCDIKGMLIPGYATPDKQQPELAPGWISDEVTMKQNRDSQPVAARTDEVEDQGLRVWMAARRVRDATARFADNPTMRTSGSVVGEYNALTDEVHKLEELMVWRNPPGRPAEPPPDYYEEVLALRQVNNRLRDRLTLVQDQLRSVLKGIADAQE